MLQIKILKVIFIIVLSNSITIDSNPTDITSQCIFDEGQILSNCYWHGARSVEEVIIRNQREFEEYGNRTKNDSQNCEMASLPLIDFTKYILVSKVTESACCRDKYRRKVFRDDIQYKIIYRIEVEYEGTCEKLCFNYNWVKIPLVREY